MKRAWAAWEQWWFAPVDARALAAMRISLGLTLVGWLLLLWPDLVPLYSDEGLIDARTFRSWTHWRVSHLDHLTAGQLHAAHAFVVVAAVAFTAGFQTRVANVLVGLALVGLWHRDPWVQNGGDRLLRMWTLYLALTPSGAAWSVDAWLARRRGLPPVREVPIFGLRLVQLQVCWMYLDTGIEKAMGGGWWSGTAIHWALADATFNRAPWLLDPVIFHPWGQRFTSALTWLTLGWELAFVPLVMWRRTRVLTLVVGCCLHLGIALTMSVGVFGWASVWGYQAFLWRAWRPQVGHGSA